MNQNQFAIKVAPADPVPQRVALLEELNEAYKLIRETNYGLQAVWDTFNGATCAETEKEPFLGSVDALIGHIRRAIGENADLAAKIRQRVGG